MTATPRSLPAATRMLERYAELDGKLAIVEAVRSEAIAKANASADAEAGPLLKQMGDIQAALELFWSTNSAALTEGKRKSIELGGCIIGSRSARPALVIQGEEKDVVEALRALRWAKPFVRVKYSLDKTLLLKSLDGKHGVALAQLGIGRSEGEEQFYIERAEQAGTLKP
jgi:phage host-nuclease inhibitor protein Gam